jgi:hypothetical protein
MCADRWRPACRRPGRPAPSGRSPRGQREPLRCVLSDGAAHTIPAEEEQGGVEPGAGSPCSSGTPQAAHLRWAHGTRLMAVGSRPGKGPLGRERAPARTVRPRLTGRSQRLPGPGDRR